MSCHNANIVVIGDDKVGIMKAHVFSVIRSLAVINFNLTGKSTEWKFVTFGPKFYMC